MKNKWYDLTASVEFTAMERRLILILLTVISMVILSTYFVKFIYQGDPELSQNDLLRLTQMLTDHRVVHQEKKYAFDMIDFDPNTVTAQSLAKMGWPEKTSQTLVNFRNTGFVFKTKEDLMKVIGIDSVFYKEVEPWVDFIDLNDQKDNLPTILRDKDNLPKKSDKHILTPFDPNTVTAQELINMGWEPKPAFTLVSYRKKVKPFKVKGDLKVIRGLSDSAYQSVAPFILLPDTLADMPSSDTIRYFTSKEKKYKRFKRNTVNINQADTSGLVDIYGVGPYTAKLIENYRNRLGGFYDKTQLYEIDKIERDRLDSIMPYIIVDDSYKILDVKKHSFSDLLRHPYLEYESVVDLKNYFRKRPQTEYLDSFMEKSRIHPDTLMLLKPYLILPKETQKSLK